MYYGEKKPFPRLAQRAAVDAKCKEVGAAGDVWGCRCVSGGRVPQRSVCRTCYPRAALCLMRVVNSQTCS